jgi:hypothetical protein
VSARPGVRIDIRVMPAFHLIRCAKLSNRGGEGRRLSYLSNFVNEWPMVRVSALVILAFCCATPLVWLFSNLVVYGLRPFL